MPESTTPLGQETSPNRGMGPPDLGFRGLRVCVVGPFLPRPGGVSVQGEMLCQFLEGEGAVVRRVDTNVELIRQDPFVGRWLLPFAQVLAVLVRLLWNAPRSDVIHAQAASDWGFFLPVTLSLLIGRIFRRRVVVSYFGGGAADFMKRHVRLAWPILRRLDGFAVSSAFLKEVFQRYGLAPAVIPSVIDLERYPYCPRTDWPPLILWMRRLLPSSNPAMALRAFAAVQQSIPEARLLMVGRGPLADEVGALARELGLASKVGYQPWLPFHRLRNAMQTASVIWNTNLVDNFPLSLLEAAATGAVIVSTDVGGVQELLHNGVDGLLVAPDDAQALAAASVQVLRRPLLAEGLSRNARLAVERYSWAGIRSDMARLYALAPGAQPVVSQAVALDAAARDGLAVEPGDDVLARTEFLLSEPDSGTSATDGAFPPGRGSRRRLMQSNQRGR